ncbi:2-oxoglutarate dehydrogenase E1 component [bacterium]|nr:2-oxoglutarate dehydrogenase E1 component [bacterium]
MDLDFILRANPDYIDDLYRQYRRDPGSVGADWAHFFAGFELGSNGHRAPAPATAAAPPEAAERIFGVQDLIHSYRELGHLIADLNPLGGNLTEHPLLAMQEFGFRESDLDRLVECPHFRRQPQATLRELITLLKATYCRTIAVEYMYISDKTQRDWLKERMEPTLNEPQLTAEDRRHVYDRLVAATGFEEFLHTKYVGQKRFSLEGAEVLIPLLDTLVEESGGAGVEEIVMGMPHRGRLNVLANVLRKPYEMILAEFEGSFLPNAVQGDGDVKYHLGYARDHTTRSGRTVHVSLLSNPSHLEAVNPVAEGIVRAKQMVHHDRDGTTVMPLLIHGDAAFTGQGLVTETLALSELANYRTGGTIHVIVDNQVGFTARPEDYRFTRYASDVAKVIQAPVFHVNGNDPEAAVQAARLAAAYRNRFRVDVIINILCYRRHGHNETDDPTFTQPTMYTIINALPTVRELYAQRLIERGVLDQATADRYKSELRELLEDAINYARDFMPRQQVFALGGLWKGFTWAGSDWSADTRVPAAELIAIADAASRIPDGFDAHPRQRKLLEERAAAVRAGRGIDWACAEMLAFGSLLREGTNVRLAGQDSGRGTFSQRHAVLTDRTTAARHVPLQHLAPDQGWLQIVDTMLSEAAVLGFEYGFSSADPRNLVLWEAQFGDFANGAQVMIDQFISSAESKWQRMSGLVMLLPHGLEGQGPEHSSARLERYLQLSAENNWQVCNLTTPAQYFHALRRQMRRNFRKPLVVMSPKSLLRHKLAVSDVAALSDGTFQPVLPETAALDAAAVRRVLLCSGKLYYDLAIAREQRDAHEVAIIRVEQLYPFPAAEIAAALAPFGAASEVCWAQEEAWNMGAWHFVHQRLLPLIGERPLRYIGRDEAASPATGSYKIHQAEQADIVDRALRKHHGR